MTKQNRRSTRKSILIATCAFAFVALAACGSKKDEDKKLTPLPTNAVATKDTGTNGGNGGSAASSTNPPLVVNEKPITVLIQNVRTASTLTSVPNPGSSPDIMTKKSIEATIVVNGTAKQIITSHRGIEPFTNSYVQNDLVMTYSAKCLNAECTGYILSVWISDSAKRQHEAQMVFARKMDGSLVFGERDFAGFTLNEDANTVKQLQTEPPTSDTKLISLDTAAENYYGILY